MSGTPNPAERLRDLSMKLKRFLADGSMESEERARTEFVVRELDAMWPDVLDAFGLPTAPTIGPADEEPAPTAWPEVEITWSDVMSGDEVYSEVTGSWWEAIEGMADRGDSQVTIANAEAGKTITFPPPANDLVLVRRGAIGRAAQALRAGGLNLEAA